MGSRDTGIYVNANSVESTGTFRHHQDSDKFSPVSQSSEISSPLDNDAVDEDGLERDVRTRSSESFEKTSNWLLQQDCSPTGSINDAVVGLERATQSTSCIDSGSSHSNITSMVAASHSEPVLAQGVTLVENDISRARSSVTVVASMPSEKASSFVDCSSSSYISTPASQNSSRQRTRQLRFSCAAPSVEDCPDSKDSDVDGSLAFLSANTRHVTEVANSPPLITSSVHNDVEEFSVDDGASLASSDTSLSDTCNSSFKSSTEDLASQVVTCCNENSLAAVGNTAELTPRIGHRSEHSPGLRLRKRRAVSDGQRLHSLSPEHVRPAEEGKEDRGGNPVRDSDLPVLDSGGGLWQPADAAVGELPRVAVSSDDDNDSQIAPHTSPSKCRQLHPRYSRSARVTRSSDKFPCHNATADLPSKDRGVRADGRRSNVRVMDIRLLESTGISSADSDGEAARLSASKSASTPKVSSAVYVLRFC